MVQFDRVPLTRRYIAKAIKFAIRNPKIAFMCLLLGIGPYMTLREYHIAKQFTPKNVVEERMLKYNDTWQHQPTIYLLCTLKKPQICLELGCRDGNTALPMLLAAKQFGGRVFSVDIETWPEIDEFRKKYHTLVENWQFINSDDLKLDWNTPIDFLYIDTSHFYDHTMKELCKYEPLVKYGGIIAFHDIADREVDNAVSDYFKNRNDIQYIRYFNNNGLGIILKN